MKSSGTNTDDILIDQALHTLRSCLGTEIVLDQENIEFYEETLDRMVGCALKWLNPESVDTESLYGYCTTGVILNITIDKSVAIEVKEQISTLVGPMKMMAMATLLTTLSQSMGNKAVVKILAGSKGNVITEAVMSTYVGNQEMLKRVFFDIQEGRERKSLMPTNIKNLIASGFKDLDVADKIYILKNVGPLGKRTSQYLAVEQPSRKRQRTCEVVDAGTQTDSVDIDKNVLLDIDMRIIGKALPCWKRHADFVFVMNYLSECEDMERFYDFMKL